MRYRLDDIATFLQVVDSGSISAAARRLNLSKSVVSKRVSGLEAALGGALLQRSTRRVLPTDRGLAFYERGRAILRQLDEAAEEVAESDGDLRGSLRVAAPMSFGTLYLGPVLFDFAHRHPRLTLTLDLDDRMVDLAGRGYDLAIRITRPRDSALIARRLAASRRVVCASPGYAEAVGLPRSLAELPQHEAIGHAEVPSAWLWQFEPFAAGGPPRSVAMRSRISVNNGEAARDAAIAGLGLAVLPTFIVADALRQGRLLPVALDAEPVADVIHALYPQTRHLSRRVRALIDHLAESCGEDAPWEQGLSFAPAERRVS
ncbi:LysR family transcriptional regulator [Inquilinus limosus]|uniref:LysR family transcriptional regulator n=1 Tax=Inquilinus limosus TaxID=171674 RepID=UPI003F17DFA2